MDEVDIFFLKKKRMANPEIPTNWKVFLIFFSPGIMLDYLTYEMRSSCPSAKSRNHCQLHSKCQSSQLHQRTYYWSGHSITPESQETRISRKRDNIVLVNAELKLTGRTKVGSFGRTSILPKDPCLLN